MSDLYIDNKQAHLVGGQPAVGYIKIADSVYIQVKRKPFVLHGFMMRIFFGWKFVTDWVQDIEKE